MTASQLLLLGGASAPAVDPYFYSVTSLLHGDGTNGAQNNTFLDSSTNNFTITRNGNTTQGSFSPFSQTGWSNYFNGSSDIRASSNAAFSPGTGNFTFEAWINPPSWATTAPFFVVQATGGLWIGKNGSNFVVRAANVADQLQTATIPSTNQWTHIVAVRSGTTLSLFFNGIRVATTTNSYNFAQGGASVGSDADPGTVTYYTGYISNARLVKGTAVYDPTALTLTVPTTPLTAISGTSLLTCQSNRFIDNSSNAFAITRNGDVSVQPFSPFNPLTPYSTSAVGGSGYFDGSGDFLTVPDNSALEFGNSTLTLELWINTTATAQYTTLASRETTGFSSGMWALQVNGSGANSGDITFFAADFSVSTPLLQSTGSKVNDSAWHHVAVVRNVNSWTLYIDGVSRSTATWSGTVADIAGAFYIGASQAFGRNYSGYMTDLRLVKGTAVYTAAFTPPTAPLTAITNTSLLINYTNAGIFDNAADADYETVGNAQISTSVKKYGTGSMSFDGTGDYLTSPFSRQWRLLNDDFTIEMWVYLSASQANMGLVSSYTSNNGWLVRLDTSAIVFSYGTGSSATVVSNSASLSTGVWYHLAWCKIGSSLKAYVNGTQVGSTATISSPVDNSTTGLQVGRTHTVANDFNGYIDDLRISKGIGRYPYNFTPPTAEFPNIGGTVTLTADPYYDYTTLLLPGNGTNGAQNNTFLDSSTNNFSITRNGNTTQGTFSPFSQTGWGNYFDGATATRLTMPSNTAFAFGTGAYTVEAWVYLNAHAANQSTVFEAGTANGALSVSVLSTGALSLGTYGVGALINSSASVVSLNQWNHVAVVRSSTASNDTKLYVNGTLVATGTDSSNWTVTTTPATGGLGLSGYTLNGYVSNLRVVKGTAVYTANFTPSTTPLTAITNTSLLTCQSNRFVDNSSNAFAITRNGDVSVQAFSPFNPTAAWSAATYGGSGYFDGSGDYLALPNNAAFAFGTGDFTIECWVNPTTQGGHGSGNNDCIIDFRPSTGSGAYGTLYIFNSGVGIYWYVSGANRITGSAIPNNAWSHIVVSRVSSNTRLFINGVQSGSTYADTTNYLQGAPWIGQFNDTTGGGFFNGYICDMRVVKGSGVTSVTVPTAPLTAITNTSFLANFTNAGILDATSKNDLETVGNAQISTTQSKFGGSSMYFDGTGDYLVTRTTADLQMVNGDFTWECWFRPNSLPGAGQYETLWAQRASTSGYGGPCIVMDSAGNYLMFVSNAAATNWQILGTDSGLDVSLNTWQHLAIVRYGNTVRIYKDGIAGTSATASEAVGTSGATTVGAGTAAGDQAIDAYIDDLRITKGIARYTSNFTPPTTAFLTL